MTSNNINCPFCYPEREILRESKYSFAIYDSFPVNEGHVLIIPKQHCENYFELTPEEQNDCIALLNEVKICIQGKYNPDGYNIGININVAAGQTIFHAHIHLIPRYSGDGENPKGGVRGVIPGKKVY